MVADSCLILVVDMIPEKCVNQSHSNTMPDKRLVASSVSPGIKLLMHVSNKIYYTTLLDMERWANCILGAQKPQQY